MREDFAPLHGHSRRLTVVIPVLHTSRTEAIRLETGFKAFSVGRISQSDFEGLQGARRVDRTTPSQRTRSIFETD